MSNIYKLYKAFADLYNCKEFRKFQNDLSRQVYESLANSYSNSDNEVKTVTDMCNTLNGKQFQNLKFYSHKIHGTRSYVNFFNQDKPVTTELADMAIICVATKGREVVLEKISFVQNKKSDANNNWNIDQNQLFLLRNFPTITGKKGFFKNHYKEEIVFLNKSNNLGTYGLFQSPGEMILVNAKSVYGLQDGSTITYDELKKHIDTTCSENSTFQSICRLDYYLWEEIAYRVYKHFPKCVFPLSDFPFLNNNSSSLNIYDFIRNWTYFNIGEMCRVEDEVIDKDLSVITNVLLEKAGLGEFININNEQNVFENNIVVLIAHMDLDKME